MRVVLTLALQVVAMVLTVASSSAQVLGTPATTNDSTSVVEVIAAYHRALANADSATAIGLLAEDAVVLESGGMESRAEYLSHHLPADIAFAAALPSVRGPVSVTISGDAAWAVSTSETRGEYRGRTIHSVGAEMMVLVRTAEGWKIAAIHWSSRNRS